MVVPIPPSVVISVVTGLDNSDNVAEAGLLLIVLTLELDKVNVTAEAVLLVVVLVVVLLDVLLDVLLGSSAVGLGEVTGDTQIVEVKVEQLVLSIVIVVVLYLCVFITRSVETVVVMDTAETSGSRSMGSNISFTEVIMADSDEEPAKIMDNSVASGVDV